MHLRIIQLLVGLPRLQRYGRPIHGHVISRLNKITCAQTTYWYVLPSSQSNRPHRRHLCRRAHPPSRRLHCNPSPHPVILSTFNSHAIIIVLFAARAKIYNSQHLSDKFPIDRVECTRGVVVDAVKSSCRYRTCGLVHVVEAV